MTQKEYKEELQHLIEQLEIEAAAIPDHDDEDEDEFYYIVMILIAGYFYPHLTSYKDPIIHFIAILFILSNVVGLIYNIYKHNKEKWEKWEKEYQQDYNDNLDGAFQDGKEMGMIIKNPYPKKHELWYEWEEGKKQALEKHPANPKPWQKNTTMKLHKRIGKSYWTPYIIIESTLFGINFTLFFFLAIYISLLSVDTEMSLLLPSILMALLVALGISYPIRIKELVKKGYKEDAT